MDNATAVLVAGGVTLPDAPTPSRTHSIASSSQSQSAARRPATRSKLLGLGSSSKSSAKSSSPPKPISRAPSKKADEAFVCQICFNDAPGLQTLALDCDHAFCTECWLDYTTSKIREESEHTVRCMAEGCALVASDTFLRDVLLGSVPATEEQQAREKIWQRLQELFVRHFVACNSHLKFCPYPSCTNTVSCPSAASKSSLITVVPTVSCGARGIGEQDPAGSMSSSQQFVNGLGLKGKEHKFCFGCPVESDHRPVICSVARMWLKKCRDDSETANWIKSNTKECSQCQSTIEKNGGCKCAKFLYLSLAQVLIVHSQPYDLQEMQARILLGLHGSVERTWYGIVLV